jgi:hypothetical protein
MTNFLPTEDVKSSDQFMRSYLDLRNRAKLAQEWLQNPFQLHFLGSIGQDGHKWPVFSIFAAKIGMMELRRGGSKKETIR